MDLPHFFHFYFQSTAEKYYKYQFKKYNTRILSKTTAPYELSLYIYIYIYIGIDR